MKNYPTFKQILSRITYGTKIAVKEYGSGKFVFDGVWTTHCRTEGLRKNILDSEVTEFAVKDGALHIEIVPQEVST